MCFGSTPGEVALPPLGELKEGTKIKIRNREPRDCKNPIGVTVGGGVNAIPPASDLKDINAKLGGVFKRAACKVPAHQRELLRRFSLFVKRQVEESYTPLHCERNINVQEWLDKSNYPDWRKQELLDVWKELEDISRIGRDDKEGLRLRSISSFVKREFYNSETHKWARIINARTDAAKVVFGPYVQAMEHIVYETIPVGCRVSPFIKHVPVSDRPKHIMEEFAGLTGRVVSTDYTSFEALFVRRLMLVCEMQLYRHLLRELPEHNLIMGLFLKVMTGTNHCHFDDMSVDLEATRMSGEMTTSLGNGFSNLMFMKFACEEFGSKCHGFVEGDDGLFVIDGPVPTVEFFTSLGLNIKLETHDAISTASFCGMIFDPDELVVVADPRKILATTPWLDGRYAGARASRLKALLRCKALSLLSQYNGCPIVAAYADYLLRATKGQSLEWAKKILRNDSESRYLSAQRGNYVDSSCRELKEPGIKTRMIVERQFGVPVDYQIYLENYFKSLTTLQGLDSNIVGFIMPDEWFRNYVKYVHGRDVKKPRIPLDYFGVLSSDRQQLIDMLRPVASAESLRNYVNAT